MLQICKGVPTFGTFDACVLSVRMADEWIGGIVDGGGEVGWFMSCQRSRQGLQCFWHASVAYVWGAEGVLGDKWMGEQE
jgi:hypothetical protein